MTDLMTYKQGVAGCITLNRRQALNALTHEMCQTLRFQLKAWAEDDDVKLLIIDAKGDKAFCAGGDISDLYRAGREGRYEYGQTFWRDEYRMNAALFEFPKPVVSFLQGFTLGGGVGVGCHSSHRIVCETSQIAMPEVSIGMVPDVGGSMILANAPGRLGEYLGTTATRLSADDAIFAGFADYFIPRNQWDDLKSQVSQTGKWTLIDSAAAPAPKGTLRDQKTDIDAFFAGETFGDVLRALNASDSTFAVDTLTALKRNSPLAMASAIEMVHRLRGQTDIRKALELEYRFALRALEHSDLLEGIRAAIIDKDRSPNWQDELDAPLAMKVSKMLMPLGADSLTF